jgi:predicted ArsR family transcriptional regulator
MGQVRAEPGTAPGAVRGAPAHAPSGPGHAPSVPAQPGIPAGSERGTRARIARLILENGPVTAAGLSTRMNLTPAAVRRHLDNLLADGMIEARTARRPASRGRGRPAKLFAITDVGRSVFEHTYDDLAASALRFLAEVAGPGAVTEFARRQVADLEKRYRPVVAAAAPGERVAMLAEALSADGYAASATRAPAADPTRAPAAEPVPGRQPAPAGGAPASNTPSNPPAGEQLCQHHCPVAHVAAEFPQLCEAETEAFGRLLGTPVQRLATIARGDGICTTHVTAPALLHNLTHPASNPHSSNPRTSNWHDTVTTSRPEASGV